MIDINASLTEETTRGLTEDQHKELLDGYTHGYHGVTPRSDTATYRWGWNGGQAALVADMASGRGARTALAGENAQRPVLAKPITEPKQSLPTGVAGGKFGTLPGIEEAADILAEMRRKR